MRMDRRSGSTAAAIVLMVAALAAHPCAAQVAAPATVRNPDFEEGQPGGQPAGWFSPPMKSYDVELVDVGAYGGKRAARISGRAQPAAGEFGNVMQMIDAAPYRGKRIRFTGFVRAEPIGGPGAMLWLRVDRPSRQMGFFDNMQDRPITASEWKRYTIVGTVAPDAERIALGMMLQGMGRAWVDDVVLEVLPDLPPPEAPRALSARGLENLVAYSRLLGYVRFFHPSDEAAGTDWSAFAVAGIRPVEAATGPARLATVLDSLFRPIAPSLIVNAGEPGAVRALAAPPAGAQQVLSWRHLGVGLGRSSVYRSERQRAPVSAARAKPLAVKLGGGVSALVPLEVFADGAGTLPHAAGTLPARADDALPPGGYDGNDRSVRLADIALAWTVFQHFYPYFDVAGTDWSAELGKGLSAAATDRDAAAFTQTLRRLVAALRDGHGRVSGPGDAERAAAPPVLLREAEGRIVVLKVGAGEAQVRMGDEVTAVDGVPVAEVLARDEALISSATPQWRRWRAVNELLLGPPQSAVKLDVMHPDGSRAALTLQRTARPGQIEETRPDPVTELKQGIWYVDLGRATDAQFAAALPQLKGARGIVFDMRGYPRLNTPLVLAHLHRTPMTSAQWHVPVVTEPDQPMRFERGGEWNLQPLEPYLAASRVFLTDGRAISYAESTMGIVEYYRLGAIVGENTAGTNGNVNPFSLPGGYSLAWTGMKVLKHDGSRHHGVGIKATVPVTRTVAGVAAGRDEQLERAVGLLEH